MIIQSSSRELGREADVGELRAAVCAAVVSACLNAFGDRLRGIVLTGSLARCEGTAVWNSGRWNVLGDAEFFLVFEEWCPLPEAARTESVRQQIERVLAEQGLRCHIDLSPVHPKYLTRLRPSILAYELKQCGRVVWGDPQLLALIPPFSAPDIPLEDAWRLLSNRMVEYLAVAPDLPLTHTSFPPAAFYRTVKLYLDMATSFLLFTGSYEPTYAARAARLRGLLVAPRCGITPPIPLHDFADRVDLCTGFKLQQPGYRDLDPAGFTGEEAVSFWRDAIEYAHRLWRWELCQLTGSGEGLSDIELMRDSMRRQPMKLRLRGWIRVFRDAGWRRSWQAWPRWVLLARRASPRHLIYAAAAELLFWLPELLNASQCSGQELEWGRLQSLLPVARRRVPATERPTWQNLACDIAWNYHEFLEETTA